MSKDGLIDFCTSKVNGLASSPVKPSSAAKAELARLQRAFPDARSCARQLLAAYGSFLGFFARTELIGKGSKGSRHEVAALQPAARGVSGEAGDNLRSQ
jgi:hypothetical protein